LHAWTYCQTTPNKSIHTYIKYSINKMIVRSSWAWETWPRRAVTVWVSPDVLRDAGLANKKMVSTQTKWVNIHLR
jgi:hypothetical protein